MHIQYIHVFFGVYIYIFAKSTMNLSVYADDVHPVEGGLTLSSNIDVPSVVF